MCCSSQSCLHRHRVVEGGELGVRVAPNRASTDTGSVEGGDLGVRVAPNRASTDTGSVEGGALSNTTSEQYAKSRFLPYPRKPCYIAIRTSRRAERSCCCPANPLKSLAVVRITSFNAT